MNKIKLVLAGTAKFSADIFIYLIKNSDFEIKAIISQPNKALDRSKNVIETDVAKLAQNNNIKLFQPNKINEIYNELKDIEYDFLITAAFGQYIPTNILNLAKKASINVHGSLLEKYRGAAPIQHALLNNEKETGISLIYMIEKMDAGDIIFSKQINIEQDDTAIEIYDKLAKITNEKLPNWIRLIYSNQILAKKQNDEVATFAPKIKNEDVEIFLSDTKEKALSKIKAFNDQPGAFIIFNNKRLKIFRASFDKCKTPLFLDFSNGKLYLIEYQFEGKKRVKHEI